MAWLHAVPKPAEGKEQTEAEKKLPKLSRMDQMKKDRIKPKMPPNPAPHIVARLVEIGITESNGMGPTVLSWREIEAWQRNVSVRLAPWEARLMRSLSIAYITEGRRAEDQNCPPPWLPEVTPHEREIDESVLDDVLG